MAIVDCAVCGRFGITFELVVDRDLARGAGPRPYLSAATRKAHESGRPLTLTTDNWRELEAEQRSIPVSEKLNQLLLFVAARSGGPGGECLIRPWFDYPLIAGRNPAELVRYLEHFVSQGILVTDKTYTDANHYDLSISGWQRLEPVPTKGGIPGRCFVAMSFDPSLDTAYENGIKPAIRECGFQPVCMKEIATNEGITDRILSEITRAQFVIADFTGQRGGVYFEAGFARGLGRDVIWQCRKDEIKLVHFDIKHLGHVLWETPDDLRTKLAESIRANIIPKQ